MSVTITVSTKLFNKLEELAGDYEELPEDFCVDDYAGGNVDDAFWKGASHGEGELAAWIIGSHEANKVQG